MGVARFDAASVIQLGILLLIATPVVRVVFCVVGFARQRDRLYVAVSSLVLAILIYSLMSGAEQGRAAWLLIGNKHFCLDCVIRSADAES